MGVIESIYADPQNWQQGQYFFEHTSGVRVWTANGFLCYAPGMNGTWSWWNKWRFARARAWWHNNFPMPQGVK